ncbi:MAG: hypothetical protein M0P71_07410 [Melioribacteraceae bacterium]|jgi:hypothetical protein|nr:hypothetical protein [Melioribacteraceae bacterium]MDD3982818.1 hypothetical protein [Candidatus Omnitrophota bacterium]
MKYKTIGGVMWDTELVLRNIFMDSFMVMCQDLRKELEITRNLKPKHIKYDQIQKIIKQYKKYEKYVKLFGGFEETKDIKESYNIFQNQFLTMIGTNR